MGTRPRYDTLLHEDAGLVSDNVGTLELALPNTTIGRADRLRRIDELLSRLTAIPDIEAAGVVNDLPLSGVSGLRIGIGVDGFTPSSGVFTVVGVVSDLRETRLEDATGGQLYLPIAVQTPIALAIVARSNLEPALLLRRMNEVVRSVDPRQAVFNLRMMQDVVDSSVAPRRTNTILIVSFALLALMLASVGVYAVVAFGVSSRAKELGIRSAMGATGVRLLMMITIEIGWVAMIGISIGLGGAWAVSQALQAMLYGVNAHDPLSFALVPLVLLIPTALATVVPAMRAIRVNPAEVMRAD